jgi:hypothetical protein
VDGGVALAVRSSRRDAEMPSEHAKASEHAVMHVVKRGASKKTKFVATSTCTWETKFVATSTCTWVTVVLGAWDVGAITTKNK